MYWYGIGMTGFSLSFALKFTSMSECEINYHWFHSDMYECEIDYHSFHIEFFPLKLASMYGCEIDNH